MWCRRSRPRPSRKSSTSTYQGYGASRARLALSTRLPSVFGPSRSSPRVGPTPCADSRGTRQDPLARLARPSQRPHPHPSPTTESSRTMPCARAGPPFPTTTLCRCVERRSPLAPPWRVFSLPPRRLSEFPSPPLALTAPLPIPPTRRPAPTSPGGGEARSPSLVPTRSRVDRRHQHSGQLRWQRERALHLPSR